MKTKKLKKFIKKNYSKDFVLNAYEFYADPTSYYIERLYTKLRLHFRYFYRKCKDNNVSILDAINYYIKNKKI